MFNRELFIRRLNDLIGEKELSLREFAAKMNIHHSTISRWLSGKSLPQADYLYLLAEFFDISADYLLGRTPEL